MKKTAKSILIVDDEIEILKVLRELFGLRGWHVIASPVGNAVTNILDKESVDIILLDIHLVDSSGLDILKAIKRHHAGIPVVIFTAYGYEDALVKRALEQGASGFVSKGVPFKELMEVVSNVLLQKS